MVIVVWVNSNIMLLNSKEMYRPPKNKIHEKLIVCSQ
jgi:hypothetical protein